MTTAILALCAAACPLGMGLVMWLAGRSDRRSKDPAEAGDDGA